MELKYHLGGILLGLMMNWTVYAAAPVRVLLLSGNSNHDWKSTTPFIEQVLEDEGGFVVTVTNQPDTINRQMLCSVDVIVSNWNEFGSPAGGWPEATKKDFQQFIEKGGGFVAIHGASATHYDWPFFWQLCGGRWGEKTHHGDVNNFQVAILHPHTITKGMTDFPFRDELWEDLELHPEAEAICTATSQAGKTEPVALITFAGKGRGFYLILGHDAALMDSFYWKKLLIRGTRWSRGENEIPL